jgi:hypothetical protein
MKGEEAQQATPGQQSINYVRKVLSASAFARFYIQLLVFAFFLSSSFLLRRLEGTENTLCTLHRLPSLLVDALHNKFS